MLIVSATDKPRDDSVTGKFGLGFKSVLLVCEEPRVLSGRLAIRVVAGILPQPWENTQNSRERLTSLASDRTLPGTLIELPGVDGELKECVLRRFRQIAGILCVFGRAIRRITHVVGTSASDYSWDPREICVDVEVGELHLRGDWGARTKALCVRSVGGSLLIALGPKGFRPLPDTVPAIWVVAPTKEESAVGFGVNGTFEVDAGRGRLAGSNEDNLEKAKRIGQEAGEALGELLERSRRDWSAVRDTLGLEADLDAVDFWESIWIGLTGGTLGRRIGDAEKVAREVALGALFSAWSSPRRGPKWVEAVAARLHQRR